MTLEAIKYSCGKLEILDQLLLPGETRYIPVNGTEDGWQVINKMQVRGAPAIGVVAALSLAVELHPLTFTSVDELISYVKQKMDYLISARPTAVNIVDAKRKFIQLFRECLKSMTEAEDIKKKLLAMIEKFQEEDVVINKLIGKNGADHLLMKVDNQPVRILTHCNTGSLATAGYGTALGVVRSLHDRNRLLQCYCTETRPYNQGSRLTAYELVCEKIPSTLICDDMVASLMKQRDITAVILGADRVTANGDTANKIGTYQLAVLAKHHGVLFYVAAPSSSIDMAMETGEEIVIEERPHKEMTTIKGISLAPDGISVWNPAFDVTPAELITGGIVTEFGVFSPAELKDKLTKALKKQAAE